MNMDLNNTIPVLKQFIFLLKPFIIMVNKIQKDV